jgi:tripartite ATP-independent transporter DctM subunit
MLFGLSGVELSLIIVFVLLFAGILTGYPVAFAISGSAALSFAIIAILNEHGFLYVIEEYNGVMEQVPVFEFGWQKAMLSTVSTWSQGVFSRAFGGNVETLLAVPLFVLMGIALERSRIAEDLLTTMAQLFGTLPGGLAISVVVVGTLLAASTGIVGATVVTMGLISLPTMLRYGYSKSLATGVIATSGTLGQIIPPSIVIVLLGSIVGDMYSIGQENRAKELGVSVLDMLGEPAVLSTGTLFKAAFIPGLFLAILYAGYAFLYALFRPQDAPPIPQEQTGNYNLKGYYNNNSYLMVGAVIGPLVVLIMLWIAFTVYGLVGVQENADGLAVASISHAMMGLSVLVIFLMTLSIALRPHHNQSIVIAGILATTVMLILDWLYLIDGHSGGDRFRLFALPGIILVMALKRAIPRLLENNALRVVSPPIILIVAVLGSILGGITNPTPAAALGAAGAIMLAASRKLSLSQVKSKLVVWGALATIVMLLLRGNFDLRMTLETIQLENQIAIWVAIVSYHIAFLGLLYSCFILIQDGTMKPIVQETTKVTSMVFVILIGSLFLSLVIRSFGGEHYIQNMLRTFEDPRVLLLVVMGVLFLLGFVLDFIEIIFIVIPIVGPVIYSADPSLMPPEWITILIAINLQTSFITPPFGFALFYLRGVAPPGIKTSDIYKGVLPFVAIQLIAMTILWYYPVITTFLPDLLPEN